MPFGEKYRENIEQERSKAYREEIERLYPREPGEADDQFRVLTRNLGPYGSDGERAAALRQFISEVRNPDLNSAEVVRVYYRDMPKDIKARLLDLLERERRRLEASAEQEEGAAERLKFSEEKERLRMLDSVGFLAHERTSEIQPSVKLAGREYFFELFGFKLGDKIRDPDKEHPGDWEIQGTYVTFADEAGVVLVRPEVARKLERIRSSGDLKEKGREMIRLEKEGYEECRLDQFALKKLRKKLDMN